MNGTNEICTILFCGNALVYGYKKIIGMQFQLKILHQQEITRL
jgi:hypothetical protein